MKKSPTHSNINLISLFNQHEALAHSSTSLPHQYISDYQDQSLISTTLLPPNGLGIRTFIQYHKSFNFGIERKTRAARKILFIFSSDDWLQCYPNLYHAYTDSVNPNQPRFWTASEFTSPHSAQLPASVRTLYFEFITSLISSKSLPVSITTTNRKISSHTSKMFLKNITRAVFSARKTLAFQHFSLGYSEIIIKCPQLPLAILVPVKCQATRIIGFISTVLLNLSLNSNSTHSTLYCSSIPMIIPHNNTIQHYTVEHFLSDLSTLSFNTNTSLLHWQNDMSTLQNAPHFKHVIHNLQQKARLSLSTPKHSQQPLASADLNFLFFSLELQCKLMLVDTCLNNVRLLPHTHHYALIRLATKWNNTTFLNILLQTLQPTLSAQSVFFTSPCYYPLLSLLRESSQLSSSLKQYNIAYLNPTTHQLLAFLIHIAPFPDTPSLSTLQHNTLMTYANHPALQSQRCRFFYCRRNAQWKRIARQLQPVLNNKVQAKKNLCLQLQSMPSINSNTLFIYNALGIGLFFNSTPCNATHNHKLEPSSEPSQTHPILPSLADAKQAAQLYLDLYNTPTSSDHYCESKRTTRM